LKKAGTTSFVEFASAAGASVGPLLGNQLRRDANNIEVEAYEDLVTTIRYCPRYAAFYSKEDTSRLKPAFYFYEW